MKLYLLYLSLLLVATAKDLVDDPIAGELIKYLDPLSWKAVSTLHTIQATVPGDLISDLQNAGIIQDPLYETNWLTSDLWDKNDWNYTVSFPSDFPSGSEVLLVFDGIKMGANIYLNNNLLGVANDQFSRYSFSVTKYLQSTNNLLVHFPAASQGIDCNGRFMACSGGWDWAPYSNTQDQHQSPTFSKGIWKSVYTVSYSTAAITHVTSQIYYAGKYPTQILTDTDHAGFVLHATVELQTVNGASGNVKVEGDWGASQSEAVTLLPGLNNVVILLAAEKVNLWWPLGLGKQTLYNFQVTWIPKAGQSVTTSRRIGFRVFTLVTANDTDPGSLAGKDGTSNFTMRFKVNGANLYSRGANVIPMEELEGRANAQAWRIMVQSAAAVKMNTLRVWGGGIFAYDVFYDTCDELGLVIYQDMMYAQNSHYPRATAAEKDEIEHQVKRLSHHPSIVIWDACNECGGGALYDSFVITTVAGIDKSRTVWPSCPSTGWIHGVDSLWGLPNGMSFQTRPGDHPWETHGPYQHGTGFKTKDDPTGQLELFDPNVPPKIKETSAFGVEEPGVYASEFGCAVMSSFESMSPTLSQQHWSLHSDPMYQRNYPCDNIIQVYWGPQDLSKTGELAFKRQLYQCILGQALELKSDIEHRRSENQFGTIIWQLNEVWPTGGWGSIEYGTPVPGQVIGGRWKPIHYWYNTLFNDLFATCSGLEPPVCFVKNDGIQPFSGTVTLSLVAFENGVETLINKVPVTLQAGAGAISWFCAKGEGQQCVNWAAVLAAGHCANSSTCIALTKIYDGQGNLVFTNEIALSPVKDWSLTKANITYSVDDTGLITIQSDGVAAYFTLTTQAQGRFSDNAFLLLPNTKKTVSFIPFGSLDLQLLKSTLRYEHVALYQ